MPLLIFFSILVRGKNDFLVKVAEFHTKNVIFKVEYLTEEQKRARIFNGFVQSDDKRSQKLQHCAYPLISGLKLFKMHHSALAKSFSFPRTENFPSLGQKVFHP